VTLPLVEGVTRPLDLEVVIPLEKVAESDGVIRPLRDDATEEGL
jgi:hypothetical protein